MENWLATGMRRLPHMAVGLAETGAAVVSRYIEPQKVEAVLGSGTNRAMLEHLLVGAGLPLLVTLFSDLGVRSGNEKISKVARTLAEVNPFFLYLMATVGIEAMQIVDHGRWQWEQVLADTAGIAVGMLGLVVMDRLTGIEKRPWQKEKLDFTFLMKKHK